MGFSPFGHTSKNKPHLDVYTVNPLEELRLAKESVGSAVPPIVEHHSHGVALIVRVIPLFRIRRLLSVQRNLANPVSG